MRKPKEIASDILDIINQKDMGGFELFFYSAGKGLLDVGTDLGYMTYDFLDTENRWRNEGIRIRQAELFKRGISSEEIKTLITYIVKIFVSKIKNKSLTDIFAKITGRQTGKYVATAFIYGEVARVLARRFIPRLLIRLGMVGVVSLAGTTSTSLYVSEDLSYRYPSIYSGLKNLGDLDLLYFLVRDYMDPFLEAIEINMKNKNDWDTLIAELINGI